MVTVQKLETDLKQQLASLADQIRSSESELIAKKEGYLKVAGALEVLEILNKEQKSMDEANAAADREALTSAGLAD
jgi:DNA repair exonuclease SbcCD ATPase subunit